MEGVGGVGGVWGGALADIAGQDGIGVEVVGREFVLFPSFSFCEHRLWFRCGRMDFNCKFGRLVGYSYSVIAIVNELRGDFSVFLPDD